MLGRGGCGIKEMRPGKGVPRVFTFYSRTIRKVPFEPAHTQVNKVLKATGNKVGTPVWDKSKPNP